MALEPTENQDSGKESDSRTALEARAVADPSSEHSVHPRNLMKHTVPFERYMNSASSGGPEEHHQQSVQHGTVLPDTATLARFPKIAPPLEAKTPQPVVSPFTSSFVTLIVGGPQSPSPEREPVHFSVHADLLTNVSPFFRAAFTSHGEHGFSESYSRTMMLPEERPDDVRYLLQWIYHSAHSVVEEPKKTKAAKETRCPLAKRKPRAFYDFDNDSGDSLWHAKINLPITFLRDYRNGVRCSESIKATPSATTTDTTTTTTPADPSPSKKQQSPPPPPAFGPLIRLWLLADRYNIRANLKDQIVERFLQVAHGAGCVPHRDDIRMLWDNTLPRVRNPLKNLMCDLYAGTMPTRRGRLLENSNEYGIEDGLHPGFLRDLCVALMREAEEAWYEVAKVNAWSSKSKVANRMFRDDGGGSDGWVNVGMRMRRACSYHEHD